MADGILKAIWARKEWGGPMSALDSANFVQNKGLVEDVSFGSRRQVTIISEESWTAVMKDLHADIPPYNRRANLMICGIDLKETRGRILQIGECRIQINGETKPCESMDQKLPGLKDALKPNWNGGAFGSVMNDGKINVGDEVVWDDA